MPQITIVGPAPEFDFGDQRRLRKHVVLAFQRHDRRSGLQRVERLLQIGGVLLLEARADSADIDPIVAAASGQQ